MINKNPLNIADYSKRKKPFNEDIRGAFFRDQTAIIHSLAFRRLKHKTQVFYAPQNDHICTRIEHVMHVATIAKTICKGLNAKGWKLNVEMAFAIGLGHDLGHAPFGHDGEHIINDLMVDNNSFIHEINSYRVVEYLSNDGRGLNLTYGVKDGIISHNGEKFEQYLEPDNQIKNLDKVKNRRILPSSYEGCIVRYSDKIAYLGRDIEDAITANFIVKEQIPNEIVSVVGDSNSQIIDTFVNDIIENSYQKEKIGLSDEKYDIMLKLRHFNYKNIYNNDKKDAFPYAERILTTLYHFLNELYIKNKHNFDLYKKCNLKLEKTFGKYLSDMRNLYKQYDTNKLPIIDFISGMTDLYAIEATKQIFTPQSII